MTERLEAVAKFVRLLESNDKEALYKISQILGIVNGVQQF